MANGVGVGEGVPVKQTDTTTTRPAGKTRAEDSPPVAFGNNGEVLGHDSGKVVKEDTTDPEVNPPKGPEAHTTEAAVKGFEVAEKSDAAPDHPSRKEDSVFSDKERGSIGVFDGVGGEPAGDVASKIAAIEIQKSLKTLGPNPSKKEVYDALVKGWVNAVKDMRDHEQANPKDKGMATTATVIQMFTENGKNYAWLLQAGDSRAYAVKEDGTFKQVSEDDSIITDLLKQEKITKEQAMEINKLFDEVEDYDAIPKNLRGIFQRRNEVYNDISSGRTTPPKFTLAEIGPDTKFLVVTSDGVHDNLTKSKMEQTAGKASNPQELVARLVDEAKAAAQMGGSKHVRAKPDDTSAVAIRIASEQAEGAKPPKAEIVSKKPYELQFFDNVLAEAGDKDRPITKSFSGGNKSVLHDLEIGDIIKTERPIGLTAQGPLPPGIYQVRSIGLSKDRKSISQIGTSYRNLETGITYEGAITGLDGFDIIQRGPAPEGTTKKPAEPKPGTEKPKPAETPPPKVTETTPATSKESEEYPFPREVVENAFYDLFHILEQTSDSELSQDERWAKRAVRESIAKSLDRGSDTVRVDFDKEGVGYKPYREEEGIPVDTLISFIKGKISDMKDTPEREALKQKLLILDNDKVSRPFYSINPDKRWDPGQMKARIEYEAYLMSKDGRDRHSDLENYITARDILSKARRELWFPPKTAKAATPAPGAEATPGGEPVRGEKPAKAETSPKVEEETGKEKEEGKGKEGTPTPKAKEKTEEEENKEEAKSIQERRYDLLLLNGMDFVTQYSKLEGQESVRASLQKGKWWDIRRWPAKIGLRWIEDGATLNRKLWIQKQMIDNNTSLLNWNMAKTGANLATAKQQGEIEQAATVKRFEEGKLLATEEAEEASGELTKMITNDILKPIIDGVDSTPDQVRARLAEFVRSHLNDPQVARLFGENANSFGDLAEYFATNLLTTGNRLKKDIEANKETLDNMAQYIHIKLGVARAGPQTANMNLTEKAAAWANRRRNRLLRGGARALGFRGVILNPMVAGGIATLGMAYSLRLAGVAGRAAAIPSLLVGGGVGFIAAGARRYSELASKDRPMQMVQSAIGEYKQGQQESPRRDKLEEFNYNFATSNELRNGGGTELISGRTRRSGAELLSLDLNNGTPEEKVRNIEDIARRIAEIRVRYNLSSTLHIDLVHWEGRLQARTAPLEDFTLVGQLEAKLLKHFEQQQGLTGDQAKAKARETLDGYTSQTPDKAGQFDKDWNDALLHNIGEQDRAFRGYALRSAFWHGVIGFGTGFGGGALSQEGIAAIGRGIFHQNIGQTILEGFVGYHPEMPTVPGGVGPGIIDTFKGLYEHGGTASLGDHLSATANPDHTLTIADTTTHQSFNGTLGADGHLHGDGNIPSDLRTELEQKGFHIDTNSITEPGKMGPPSEKHIFGPDDEWGKHATAIDHREWYAYDQPGSQGNELRGYNSYTRSSITFDMSKMELGYQHGLNPNPIDVQQVIHNGQGGIYISTGDHQGQGIWVPVESSGEHAGQVTLALGDTRVIPGSNGLTYDEAFKMIANQDALAKLAPGSATELYGHENILALNHGGQIGFVEYGRVVNNPDGTKFLQAFATIHGTGTANETITIPGVPGPDVTHTTFDITPPAGTALGNTEELTAIPIPTAFAPRRPLEDLGSPEPPPPPPPPVPISMSGGAELTEKRRQLFEQMRSKTLKENSNAELNPYEEEKDYFDRQDPEYLTEIKNLSSQISVPPNTNLKAIVCIPVAAHEESGNIYNTLKNYTYQNVSKDQFEILLFLNNPETDLNGNPLSPTATISEIERFQKDFPDFPVRFITKTLTRNQANMGTIRKYLNDIALYRHFQRGSEGGDIILISNDADQKGLAPTYIQNFIGKMANNSAEAMLGQLDWDPEAYAKYPLVHVGTRLFQYLNGIGRFETGRMPSSGANFAFKGSIYAGIGGYLQNLSGGEDVALGQAIILARNNSQDIKYAGARVSRLYTSARRAVDTVNKDLAPVEQWNKEFSAFNEDVRGLQLGETKPINYDDPKEISELKAGLERVINRTLDVYESGEKLGKDSKYYKAALQYLGIHYRVRDGNIEITNMDSLVRGLKHYQKIGVILRDIKAGKGTEESKAELKRLQEQFFSEMRGKALEPPKPETPSIEEPATSRPLKVGDKVVHEGHGTFTVVRKDDKTGKVTLEKRRPDGSMEDRVTRSEDILLRTEGPWRVETPSPSPKPAAVVDRRTSLPGKMKQTFERTAPKIARAKELAEARLRKGEAKPARVKDVTKFLTEMEKKDKKSKADIDRINAILAARGDEIYPGMKIALRDGRGKKIEVFTVSSVDDKENIATLERRLPNGVRRINIDKSHLEEAIETGRGGWGKEDTESLIEKTGKKVSGVIRTGGEKVGAGGAKLGEGVKVIRKGADSISRRMNEDIKERDRRMKEGHKRSMERLHAVAEKAKKVGKKARIPRVSIRLPKVVESKTKTPKPTWRERIGERGVKRVLTGAAGRDLSERAKLRIKRTAEAAREMTRKKDRAKLKVEIPRVSIPKVSVRMPSVKLPRLSAPKVDIKGRAQRLSEGARSAGEKVKGGARVAGKRLVEAKTGLSKTLKTPRSPEDAKKMLEGLNGDVVRTYEPIVSDHKVWQRVTFGPRREADNNELSIMLNPNDITKALKILSDLGLKRAADGKTTDFMWLLGAYDKGTDSELRSQRAGYYWHLKPSDPMITLYAGSFERIEEIMKELSENPKWKSLEESRKKSLGR